jgi:hypothetical protein
MQQSVEHRRKENKKAVAKSVKPNQSTRGPSPRADSNKGSQKNLDRRNPTIDSYHQTHSSYLNLNTPQQINSRSSSNF